MSRGSKKNLNPPAPPAPTKGQSHFGASGLFVDTDADDTDPRDGRGRKPLDHIGWREWIGLPGLGIEKLKAKIDTGARSSALHAFNIQYVAGPDRTIVRFDVHPLQRNSKTVMHCEAPLIEERYVKDSGGKATLRPVIATEIFIAGRSLTVEVTLITRDSMGFRMLIGRQAIRGQFLVDAGRSYLGRRAEQAKLKKKRKLSRAAAALTKARP